MTTQPQAKGRGWRAIARASFAWVASLVRKGEVEQRRSQQEAGVRRGNQAPESPRGGAY